MTAPPARPRARCSTGQSTPCSLQTSPIGETKIPSCDWLNTQYWLLIGCCQYWPPQYWLLFGCCQYWPPQYWLLIGWCVAGWISAAWARAAPPPGTITPPPPASTSTPCSETSPSSHIYLLSIFSILCLSAASRSFAIKPFNFLLVCNVVLGLGIRRVAYLQWLHTLTLFAAQSAVLHTAPCLHTFCTFLHCRAQLQTACILGRGNRGRGGGRVCLVV